MATVKRLAKWAAGWLLAIAVGVVFGRGLVTVASDLGLTPMRHVVVYCEDVETERVELPLPSSEGRMV